MSLTNPLADADAELRAMARYYLGLDPTPAVSEDTDAPSHRITIATSTAPKAEQLKKLKRNERDRQRSFAKRESMKEMRQQVKELEQRKQRLVERTGGNNAVSPQSNEFRSPTPPNASSSLYPSPSTPIKRENFVRLANEIEEFRRQNAVMTQQLRERDVSTGYMHNLLLEFSPDETDSDNNSSESDAGYGNKKSKKNKEPLGSGPRPFNGDSCVRFTPLTREEGLTCVRQTLQLINNARALYASDAHYHNRSKFLGWWQYTLRQGSTITFSVKKTLKNVTPAQLMATTWHLLTDGKRTQKLIPSTVNTHIRPLQKLSDDLFVIDRRSEDNARSGVMGNKLALRTVYVLFRVAEADGTQTLAMKTINLPLVKKLLRDDEQWCEIFYWIRMSPDGSVRSSTGDFATVMEFGGSNTYTRDEIAKAWLAELVFLAIRWESLAVAPTLLKF
ncbi:hypothetical protein PI124_g15757 [Phytophthora idaei]|nr:hypothetical protein PI125_g3800 [Phytophthora idaei]KAG3143109.1 hypothetical protein PI126_g14767 [Phytophthora idaei]KAG3239306.1 hypothetical protein PI124_g15757 [Phytophthora idaei]